MNCKHCGGDKLKKNGTSRGKQRYLCKECGKTFSDKPPKFNNEDKKRAISMYLNNVGIRKTALFIGCSRTTVMKWVQIAEEKLDKMIDESNPNYSEIEDIIEFDEIYTFVKKNCAGL
jgi:transposase-like protein